MSPFPAGDHKAAINRRESMTYTDINDPQKKNRLGTVSKNVLLEVSQRQPHPQFRCGARQIDVWFA